MRHTVIGKLSIKWSHVAQGTIITSLQLQHVLFQFNLTMIKMNTIYERMQCSAFNHL